MIEPLQIVEESERELSIGWSDGTETSYMAAELRRAEAAWTPLDAVLARALPLSADVDRVLRRALDR